MANANKPLIIPVFIPHMGCPHQCLFCNQAAITHETPDFPTPAKIDRIVEEYLAYQGSRTRVELAFFGGNFLGIGSRKVRMLLDAAAVHIASGKIDGVRFSTRPDTVSPRTLEWIAPYKIAAVELGVQSMTDAALNASNRGHTSQDTVNAVRLLKDNGYTTGVQLMVGLPGETPDSLIQSTRAVASLGPDIARIYPLLVLAKSPLARMYAEGDYQPVPLETAVEYAKQMVLILTCAGVTVIRVGLQASELMTDPKAFLAGPWHPAFGHLVFSKLLYDDLVKQVKANLAQNRDGRMTVFFPPEQESRVRGNRNENVKKLVRAFPGITFGFKKEGDPADGRIRVVNETV